MRSPCIRTERCGRHRRDLGSEQAALIFLSSYRLRTRPKDTWQDRGAKRQVRTGAYFLPGNYTPVHLMTERSSLTRH